MPPPEQLLMPKGIDAVVPWDYTCSLMINERKNGRSIDVSYPYNIYQGSIYVRLGLVDNVPDVVQRSPMPSLRPRSGCASTSSLRGQHDDGGREPKERAAHAADAAVDRIQQLRTKPTYLYPIRRFLGERERAYRQVAVRQQAPEDGLHAEGFLQRVRAAVHEEHLRSVGLEDPDGAANDTAGWAGKLGELPYPAYDTILTMKGPQAFPEKG